MPLNRQGILILPPMSDPREKGTHLEATSPPSPPELPPHDLSLLKGFLETPQILFSE
jgi:hypothetical protein